MKQKLLCTFYYFISCIGLFYLFYWINRNKKIILTYHHIIPDALFDNSVHLGVSHCESVFENHIQLINRRFSKNKILITFDDGYKNQFEIAAKILENHGLRGIFFITFQLIVNKSTLIIDKIMQWVSYVPVGHYQLANMQFSVTAENRHQIASMFYETLLSNYLLWDTIEDQLNSNFSFDDLKMNLELKRLRFEPISESHLSILINNGHTVAAHSWDHRPLSTLPIKIQKQDFDLCKNYAEKYCNSDLYSYPYGGIQEVSPAAICLCKEYGFAGAYTNNASLIWPEEDANFQMPRISLPNHSNRYVLDAKLSGFEFFCKMIIKKLLVFTRVFQWKEKIILNG